MQVQHVSLYVSGMQHRGLLQCCYASAMHECVRGRDETFRDKSFSDQTLSRSNIFELEHP